ncbi:hypothetical protein E2C01_000989 [Portunus trituberculatus]|uniref:Uncharacterized protein n=1 Tax=Portunus trituberculatus TaxID=210409 RepID=A0A5B7CLD6_PORTR|nr:hypothetical protein [Portunus trituberculatus]
MVLFFCPRGMAVSCSGSVVLFTVLVLVGGGSKSTLCSYPPATWAPPLLKTLLIANPENTFTNKADKTQHNETCSVYRLSQSGAMQSTFNTPPQLLTLGLRAARVSYLGFPGAPNHTGLVVWKEDWLGR